MRMEKINDRQIRCVITNQDLFERKISVRELKYGSKATTDLFREVLNQASSQFGFNEEELPVMIEAVPVSPEELLVIISAVEDAEELDPHFARFNEDPEAAPAEQKTPKPETFYNPEAAADALKVCVLSFSSIDEVMRFCHRTGSVFPGKSLLYREEKKHVFYLVLLRPEEMSGKEFNVFLNSVMEYGEPVRGSSLLYAYLKEHKKPVMEDPLKRLGSI